MREVLLIDVALWVALITLAALIIIRRWRRSRSWNPAHEARREAPQLTGPEAPELTGAKVAPPKPASVTRPGEPASVTGPSEPVSVTRAGENARAPDGAAPRPARPARAAPPQVTQMAAGPNARPYRPGARRDGRQTPTRAATPSDRIVSYYDQADQPIADYLAALGWAEQPPTPPIRRQAEIRVLPPSPKKAQPTP